MMTTILVIREVNGRLNAKLPFPAQQKPNTNSPLRVTFPISSTTAAQLTPEGKRLAEELRTRIQTLGYLEFFKGWLVLPVIPEKSFKDLCQLVREQVALICGPTMLVTD